MEQITKFFCKLRVRLSAFVKYFSERNFKLSKDKNLVQWNTFSKETASHSINYVVLAA